MRAVLVVSVVLSGLIWTGVAQAERSFTYDQELATVARESLWHSVTEPISRAEVESVKVRCYRDKRTFERTFEARFDLSATTVIAYYAGGPDLHLRDGTCANVRAFLTGTHTVFTAAAYAVLLHEALHRQGVRDERITTCLANEAVRSGASWFGFDTAEALRARNLAFTFTKRFSPADYRMGKPNCLLLTRRTDWVDHRVRAR